MGTTATDAGLCSSPFFGGDGKRKVEFWLLRRVEVASSF